MAALPGSFRQLSEPEYELFQKWSDAEEHRYLAPDRNNPVFKGLHADPDILYSNLTGKYYIYPTTDGSFGWHSHDFRCFSSPDFRTWTDEGVILDLHDLDWGKEYAWAPCIIEKPVMDNGTAAGYRYYFYFVANKSIGVAVADDMTSFVPGTMHELIPRDRIGEYHYLEGSYVFERNGLYYFMWSENITRSAKYRIRYLISDSPTELVRNGQPARVEEEIILQMDPEKQIFGTGHNSVLNVPGTDEWYMVYHRFTRPEGIKMGLSGGYNREICIDPMYFREDGTIIPVVPSL